MKVTTYNLQQQIVGHLVDHGNFLSDSPGSFSILQLELVWISMFSIFRNEFPILFLAKINCILLINSVKFFNLNYSILRRSVFI